VNRVYDAAGNVIGTPEHKGDFEGSVTATACFCCRLWPFQSIGSDAIIAFMNLLFRSLLIVATVLTLALQAFSQLDPGNFYIIQNGKTVGEIFVPQRRASQRNYVEHWILFRDYVYPATNRSLSTTIKANRKRYVSETDFFTLVPWGPGYRYVRIDVTDTQTRPRR